MVIPRTFRGMLARAMVAGLAMVLLVWLVQPQVLLSWRGGSSGLSAHDSEREGSDHGVEIMVPPKYVEDGGRCMGTMWCESTDAAFACS